ncbi:uroplakin-1a [Phyllobates terribilis]|uniref:uroplakin-1a n=1 Tax=Phyllobates terribilis TaxID=111132 RepID=UPI003CCAF743
MAEKGSSGLVAIIVFGNVVIMLCGLALFAETIWATTDPYYIYPVLGATGKDDVFAGGWIGIFCGFSFFVLGVYGIVAAIKGSRTMLMVYLVLMMIVYIFECASCITSFTHRDYMINSNVIKAQMLSRFADNTSSTSIEITNFWKRVMLDKQCCGVDGPKDWVDYSSTFRSSFAESVAPWPFWCCARDNNFQIVNVQACRVGLSPYVYTTGCFQHIGHAINSYTWGISWFGFAILMWTMLVMFATMYHYFTM